MLTLQYSCFLSSIPVAGNVVYPVFEWLAMLSLQYLSFLSTIQVAGNVVSPVFHFQWLAMLTLQYSCLLSRIPVTGNVVSPVFEWLAMLCLFFQAARFFLTFPWLMTWFVYSIGSSPNLHSFQYHGFKVASERKTFDQVMIFILRYLQTCYFSSFLSKQSIPSGGERKSNIITKASHD